MMIHGYIPKSKPKKLPKHLKQQHDDWMVSIQNMRTNFTRKTSTLKTFHKDSFPTYAIPAGRETTRIPSHNPHDMSPCLKKSNNSYTGNAILGIGTLHKSNAVPIFNSQEAIDISKMRR